MAAALPTSEATRRDSPEPLRRSRLRLSASFLLLYFVAMLLAGPLTWTTEPDGPGAGRLALLLVLAGGLPGAMAIAARRVLEPIVELGASNDRLQRLYGQARLDSLIDPISGLGNHRAFQEEMIRQIEDARRNRHPLALVLIDLDDLKRINDERGHAGGDELLGRMGRLVAAVCRAADRGFRVGGDEFALLLPHADLRAAEAVTRRLLASALSAEQGMVAVEPFSFSAGISAYPELAGDGRSLARQADAALYWAKGHGRTDVQVFDMQRHGQAADRRSIAELTEAVSAVASRGLVVPIYQPIFSLKSGEVVGIEGLVRPTEESGFHDAGSLFVAAEAAERTVELDLACVAAVAQGAELPDSDVYLSLNISPRSIETEQFHVVDLVKLLEDHGIPANRVVLELTEREAVTDMSRLRANLERCQSAGFRVAADDVGAGNAGLRLLSEIRFDIVKIDLSLVQGGVLRDSALAVLKAIRDIGTQSGAVVVAEGIETSDQLEIMRALDLAAGQGYLLAPPGPNIRSEPLDVTTLLEAHAERRRAMGAWFDLQIA